MALIFADDFQTFNSPTNGSVTGLFVGDGLRSQTPARVQAYGFDLTSSGTSITSVNYVKDTGLGIKRQGGMGGGVNGLRRQFRYTGDTVRFSFQISLSNQYPFAENFISFNDGMYNVGIDANGFYTVNGVSTTMQAYFGVDTKIFHEIIFTPTKMEFWVGETLVASVDRTSVPIKYLLLGFAINTGNASFVGFLLHSMIVADNSGTTFNTRIGRKAARTFAATAIDKTGSTIEGGGTALTTINQVANDPASDTGGAMIGNLYSSVAYTADSFTFTKDSITPLGALVNIQTKRRSPAPDKMLPRPFITIGATKIYGNPTRQPSSLWNVFCTEIQIVSGQTFTGFTAGYDRDYLQTANQVYASGHANVEVYGDVIVNDGYALVGSTYVAKKSTVSNQQMAPTTYNAYVSDYAKSSLTLNMTSVNNATYSQDQ